MKDKKGEETKYAHDSKLFYCIVKAEDTYDEITVQSFADTFKQKLSEVGFQWNHRNYPSADTIRNKWFHRWHWEECSRKFTEDILEEDDLLFTYRKANSKHIPELMKERDALFDEIRYLRSSEWFDTPNEKEKAIQRAVRNLKDVQLMLRLLLGLSTSNSNVDANMEAKVESVGQDNIFSYSAEEMERIQNISNDNEDFLDKL